MSEVSSERNEQPRSRLGVKSLTQHTDSSESEANGPCMNDEKIAVRVTTTGQTLDVVVLSKRVDVIEIVLGEGVHSVRCRLTPTRNGMAYVGNAMGREIVYERARGQVAADLDHANAGASKFNRR